VHHHRVARNRRDRAVVRTSHTTLDLAACGPVVGDAYVVKPCVYQGNAGQLPAHQVHLPRCGTVGALEHDKIKEVALPESMKRSMSRQAEAELERRDRVITAEGELQASQKLARAAAVVADTPAALQPVWRSRRAGLLATTLLLMVRGRGPVEDEHRVISFAAVVLGLTAAGIFIAAGLSCAFSVLGGLRWVVSATTIAFVVGLVKACVDLVEVLR
jgi:hypothetical protein